MQQTAAIRNARQTLIIIHSCLNVAASRLQCMPCRTSLQSCHSGPRGSCKARQEGTVQGEGLKRRSKHCCNLAWQCKRAWTALSWCMYLARLSSMDSRCTCYTTCTRRYRSSQIRNDVFSVLPKQGRALDVPVKFAELLYSFSE